MDDGKFTEDGLAFFIASKKPWHEELHARPAIEAARDGHIFNDRRRGRLTTPRTGIDREIVDEDISGSIRQGTAVKIENLLSWKQQMERDVQKLNSAFSVATVQNHGEDCNTASVTRNDCSTLPGVTYDDPKTTTVTEASLPPVDPSMLKADQHRAYDIVTRHLDQTLSGRIPLPLRMLILGEGGTGKSKVIQTIMAYFAHQGVVHMLINAAYTGVAASIVDRKTTHTIAMVSTEKDTTLSDKSKGKLQQFWQHIHT